MCSQSVSVILPLEERHKATYGGGAGGSIGGAWAWPGPARNSPLGRRVGRVGQTRRGVAPAARLPIQRIQQDSGSAGTLSHVSHLTSDSQYQR
eukprot:scaffold131209_cov63-Phaeocystis_antarctica.AAC.6